MKKIALLFVILAVTVAGVLAQSTVSGVVTDENGEPIPGATVRAKSISDLGTITDLNGNYSLDIPSEVQILVFSYIGKETQEIPINGQSTLNTQLAPASVEVEEVVVTALGIKRETKKMGYAATSVQNEELTRTKEGSALNALRGKVAGVNISNSSGAPGSSTRVIMRGFSSITGNNQPLFIIDGVPVDNTRAGSTSINGGTDFGNAINDINPDDIENITVLKGASSTALYGSRAANGVIIITTKSGSSKKRKGNEVTVSSSVTFDSPLRLPQWQNEYGQGFFGRVDIRENTSWGPKFDGEDRYWGYTIYTEGTDGQRKLKPYEALPKNVYNFFDIGHTYNNTVSFAGGGDKTTFYVSYGNVYSDGIMPQDHDVYNRNNLRASGSAQLSNGFSVEGAINYVKKQSRYVMTGQGAVSVYNQILQVPRDIPIHELEDYESEWNNLDNFYSAYMLNPYYVLNEFGNENNQDRIYGNAKVTYTLNDNLSAFFRVGTDVTNEQRFEYQPITEPLGNNEVNQSWVNLNEGSVTESSRFRREINTDFIIQYSKVFETFDFNLMLGHNMNQRNNKTLWEQVVGLDVPFYYNLSNSGNLPAVFEGESKRRLIGAFANLDASFRDLIFLNATFRRDWSSTLPLENNAYDYPGVNMSFVFSELLPKGVRKVIEFGKIRGGWAKVGRDAAPYQVHPIMVQAGFSNGYTGTGMSFPMADGLNAYSVSTRIGNPNLSPEFKTEMEAGVDMRFFGGRFTVDYTYYYNLTTDLIFSATMPYSSGYASQTINFGEIENKGHELRATFFPVRAKNLTWSITGTFTKNYNKVLKLPESLMNEESGEREYTLIGIGLPATGYTSFTAFEGYPLAVFTVNDVMRVEDENSPYYGSIIVDAQNGLPKVDTEVIKVGDSNHDYTMGISNQISYKGLNFTFSLDYRKGGLMYSRTAEMTYFSGTNTETLYNDRQPFIIENSVVEVFEDNEVVGYVENITPIVNTPPSTRVSGNMHEYWGNGGNQLNRKFLLDKSFLKLRDVSLSYSLPKKWLDKTFMGSATVSVIGRNLLIFTPEENRFIDPEATSFGTDLAADYGEYGNTPSIKSVGFSLKFQF